jgi:hypothetical protein
MNTSCFPQEVWEEYAMGMRSEADCRSLEEHLLICFTCQDILAGADEYIQAIAAAAALFASRTRRRLSKPMAAAATLA